ncbi:LOW QUALITY PROTEIN: ankyrin repeat domain-containing protein 26-like [Mobula hypostoma]|uniref:LOW QUALITY PROTEIN: ankyrin repeat domain-containing protein 26-like n=1 Tax=Mobula hypostoma TaxID=723540 RepID=UPI002FC2B99C
MKRILQIASRKIKQSSETCDTSSEIRVGYELKEEDLGKLHKAAYAGDLNRLRQLIKKKDVNQLDKQNRAPLHLACANGHADVVALLVENKSNLNICDNENRSPLMKAVQCEQERCVVILLSHDADPNLVDINGYTALHLAVLIPNITLATHLLEYGTHIDARDKNGYTPLLLAATRNHQKMAKCLLKKGADVNAKDKTGKTTLMIAASNGQTNLVKRLLRHGTDASLKDDNGWTADDYALRNGQHACSHLITEHHTKKRRRSSRFKSGAMKEMPSRSDHSAEVNLGFGEPAMNKEMIDDISLTEPFSGESKSAVDSWLSSDEEDNVPCSSKTIQKSNLTNLLNSSQRNKKNMIDDISLTEPFSGESKSAVGSWLSSDEDDNVPCSSKGMFLEEEEAQPLKACSKRNNLGSNEEEYENQHNQERPIKQDHLSFMNVLSAFEDSSASEISADKEKNNLGSNEEEYENQHNQERPIKQDHLSFMNVLSAFEDSSASEISADEQKNNLGSNEEEYENQHNQERPIKQDHLSFMNVLPAFEDSSASEISADEQKNNLGSNEEEYENQHNQERPIKQDHLSFMNMLSAFEDSSASEISADEEKNNLGSNEEEYENQHNQERPIKQDHLSFMNVLPAFEDSSASEISADEERARKASSNEMMAPLFDTKMFTDMSAQELGCIINNYPIGCDVQNHAVMFNNLYWNGKAMNISDDLSNLTQLFDSSESDSESSDLMHTIKAQLFQIDVETIDSVSLLKIQNMVQEYERELERERKDNAFLAKEVKYLANERKELGQILMEAGDKKLILEYKIMEKDLEVKYYNFRMKQEKEKRITAEMLLEKSCEHLQRKESQYCEEIQAKHKSEQMLRNLEIERDTVMINLKKLSEENKELQIQLNQEKAKCEEILNRHLHNQQKIAEENNTTVLEIEPLAQCDNHHNEEALMEHNCTLQQEVTVLKRELKYLCEHHQEEREKYMEQIETLKVELEDTKKGLRSSQNNLTQTNLQDNSQLNAMKSEVLLLTSKLETQRTDQQNEKESILSRLNATIQELERSQKANCEFRQILQRECDEWVHLDEKRNNEISNLCAISKEMSHKLTKEERKANDLDKKLHHAKLSLAEKNSMLESVQKELKQFQEHVTDPEQTNKVEKGQLSKHEVSLVSLQERLAQAHSEITLLRQQLEDAQNKVIMKEKVVTDVQDKFNNTLAKLQKDSEQRISLLEKRNEELLNKNMEQSKYENEIGVKEASFRQLQQDLADSLKKLAMSEASLEVVTRSRDELEGENDHLQNKLHGLKIKLEVNREKNLQSEREIQQLQNALKDKEYEIIAYLRMGEALSTSSQRDEPKKHLKDQIQRLKIENAQLKAAAKEQTNTSELLEMEIKESQSCTKRKSRKGTSVEIRQHLCCHLEEELKPRSKLYRMKTLLKTTKKKLKQNEVRLIDSHINGNEEPDNEQNETADTVSTLKRKIHELSHQIEGGSAKCKHLESTNEEQIKAMHFLQKSHDHLEQRKQQLEEEILHMKTQAETQSSYLKSYKKKMKKQARKEVIQKMEEVNTFLKIHQVSSETLEEIKASNELSSRYELEQRHQDLEWELNKFRTSQQEILKLKGPAEKEIEINKELHSLQSKPCESIAAQLNE